MLCLLSGGNIIKSGNFFRPPLRNTSTEELSIWFSQASSLDDNFFLSFSYHLLFPKGSAWLRCNRVFKTTHNYEALWASAARSGSEGTLQTLQIDPSHKNLFWSIDTQKNLGLRASRFGREAKSSLSPKFSEIKICSIMM